MTARARIAQFLGWWLAELGALVPPGLRRAVRGRRRRLWLLLHEAGTEFIEESGQTRAEIGALAADAGRAQSGALYGRLGAGRRWSEILAVIPAERVLHRRLDLPAAVAENLQESVGFEIDRFTPFKAADVVYKAQLAGQDRQRGRIACDVWLVPRAIVEEAFRRAEGLRIRPDRLCVEAGPGGTRPVELPTDLGQPLARRLSWRLPAGLAGIGALLGLAAVLLQLDNRDALLDAYAKETATYREAASAAADLRQRLRVLAATEAAAASHRAAMPLTVDVLADITQRLPDDTWLTELRLSDGHLFISGYAGSAASLVSVVENSPLFHNARLSGAVVPDAGLKRERFSLEADLKPKAGS